MATETLRRTAAEPLDGRSPQDEQLCRMIRRALRESGHTQFCNVRVTVERGQVVLAGRVSTWYLKSLVQTLVLSIAGVRGLENSLVVSSR